MSTDDGDRVDQYFVLRYTEVCIIIQYRLNLNHKGDRRRDLRTILTRTRTNFKQKAPTSTGELGVLQWFIGWAPRRGDFYIYIVSLAACAAPLRQSCYYSFTHEHQRNKTHVNITHTTRFYMDCYYSKYYCVNSSVVQVNYYKNLWFHSASHWKQW